MLKLVAAIFALVATAMSGPALAQETSSTTSSSSATAGDDGQSSVADVLSHMPKEIIACQPHDNAQEAADTALAEKAWASVTKKDVPALAKMLPDLEAAAARSPDKPSLPERCGDKLTIYSADMMEFLIVSGTVMADKTSQIKSVVQHAPLPYARLNFIVGWVYYEQDQLEKAVPFYARGLLDDPRDTYLASEYANVLSETGHADQALTFVDRFLADNKNLSDRLQALMLRRRGYALGELGRHQDAITAYRESQKYDSKNTVAANEIQWNTEQLSAEKR